jgi:hypothetical protein
MAGHLDQFGGLAARFVDVDSPLPAATVTPTVMQAVSLGALSPATLIQAIQSSEIVIAPVQPPAPPVRYFSFDDEDDSENPTAAPPPDGGSSTAIFDGEEWVLMGAPAFTGARRWNG